MYMALNVIGPLAEDLLGELTDTPMSVQHFGYDTCKVCTPGPVCKNKISAKWVCFNLIFTNPPPKKKTWLIYKQFF